MIAKKNLLFEESFSHPSFIQKPHWCPMNMQVHHELIKTKFKAINTWYFLIFEDLPYNSRGLVFLVTLDYHSLCFFLQKQNDIHSFKSIEYIRYKHR